MSLFEMRRVFVGRALSRRHFLITGGKLSVAGASMALLAACGGGDDEDGEPTATTATGGSGGTSGGSTPSPGGAGAGTPATTVGGGSSADVKTGGTLTYGTLGDVEYGSLDMPTTTGTFDLEIGRNLNAAYIWMMPDNTFVPGLAESWEISPDALQYTFKLRQDVTFHDGNKLDAEAAKWNFDRMMDKSRNASGLSYSYLGGGSSYDSCEVIDPHTFRINLNSPNAILLFRIRRKYISPQSPQAVEEAGDQYFRNPVSCGPFKFEEWVEGDHVSFVKFPEYKWGPPQIFGEPGPAYIDKLVHRIFKDANTKAVALETGEVDYAAGLATEDIVRFQDNDDLEVIIRDKTGQSMLLSCNVEKAPTDDPAVRQAIAWSIERDGMVESVLFGLVEPAYHVFTPNMFSYDASLESLMQYDPDKAEQTLEQAGWVKGSDGIRAKGGNKLNLIFVTDPTALTLAQYIQAELKKVGMNVEIQTLQGAGLVEAQLNGQHNITGGERHWIQEDPDVLRNWAHSSLIDVRQNYVRARNAELDELLDQGIAFQGDPHSPERAKIYQQAQKIIMENYYVVPLYYNRSFEAKRKYVNTENIGYDPYGTYHEWIRVWLDQ